MVDVYDGHVSYKSEKCFFQKVDLIRHIQFNPYLIDKAFNIHIDDVKGFVQISNNNDWFFVIEEYRKKIDYKNANLLFRFVEKIFSSSKFTEVGEIYLQYISQKNDFVSGPRGIMTLTSYKHGAYQLELPYNFCLEEKEQALLRKILSRPENDTNKSESIYFKSAEPEKTVIIDATHHVSFLCLDCITELDIFDETLKGFEQYLKIIDKLRWDVHIQNSSKVCSLDILCFGFVENIAEKDDFNNIKPFMQLFNALQLRFDAICCTFTISRSGLKMKQIGYKCDHITYYFHIHNLTIKDINETQVKEYKDFIQQYLNEETSDVDITLDLYMSDHMLEIKEMEKSLYTSYWNNAGPLEESDVEINVEISKRSKRRAKMKARKQVIEEAKKKKKESQIVQEKLLMKKEVEKKTMLEKEQKVEKIEKKEKVVTKKAQKSKKREKVEDKTMMEMEETIKKQEEPLTEKEKKKGKY